ncbi:MAG: D-glycero-beta-D-manno-heptose 1,7-bisphosphate 7-phosphatase [Nitrosomonadales bacterium]|jgi:D-glycero-D-manno-heptose 1,7-bisphosphate phosphatase
MKLIVLDRDGVINQDSANYIKSPNEWIPIPRSIEAISELTHNGFAVIIATNQSGIGRGLYSMDDVNQIHNKMHQLLSETRGRVDSIFICPHVDEDDCDCRKPKKGLLEQIEDRYQMNLKDCYGIGDSTRDLIAYHHAKMKPILVKTGNGISTFQEKKYPKGIKIFNDLYEAATFVIKNS